MQERYLRIRIIEEQWVIIKNDLSKTAAAELKVGRHEVKRKPWVTAEILKDAEEKRKYKNQKGEGERRYKELRNQIYHKCKEAKEAWLNNKCKKLKTLMEEHKTDQVYKLI